MIIRKSGLSAQELRQVLIDIYRGAIHEGGGARYSIEVVRIDKEQSAEPMTEEEESYAALWERHQGLISRIDIEAVNHPHIEPVRTVTVLDTQEYLDYAQVPGVSYQAAFDGNATLHRRERGLNDQSTEH